MLNMVLIGLVLALFVGAIWLVVLYNNVVNLNHGYVGMKDELQKVQAANIELKEQIFNALDPSHFKEFAAQKNLIQDKSPQYLEIGSPSLTLLR